MSDSPLVNVIAKALNDRFTEGDDDYIRPSDIACDKLARAALAAIEEAGYVIMTEDAFFAAVEAGRGSDGYV